jgi:FkbM family methyltransferase
MSLRRYLKNIAKIMMGKVAPGIKASISFRNILAKNFAPGHPFTFIQVGAWDGIGYDPLYEFVKKYDAKGIVIEPLPDYFEKLSENYAFNTNIVAVNKAVHPYLKEIELFRVDPDRTANLPGWAGGIASIDPEHHKKSGIPSEVIISQKVPSEHLMSIVGDHYHERSVNLMQIDTEGFDYEVLKQVDFSVLKPEIIKFEFINLDNETIAQTIKLLKKNAYYCFFDDVDIIATNLWKTSL